MGEEVPHQSSLKSGKSLFQKETMKKIDEAVLIVDDDDGMRELAEVMCKQMKLKTFSASDTVAARRYLEENIPRLILLDIMMPDGNGIEFCQWMRSQEEFKNVSIIVTSALKEEETIQDAFKVGANDFLSKPFELAIFMEKMGRWIKDK